MSIDDLDYGSIDLRALARVGSDEHRGGTALVFRVSMNGALWACKQYNDKERAKVDVTWLHKLISWRRGLAPEARRYLDRSAAWPRCLVHDDQGVAGLILPLAPAGFLDESKPERFKPRDLTWATRPHEEGRPYYELPEKLARLGRLGELMIFLHGRGVVIGDLQPKNVLTTAPTTQPDILLIDCDSVVLDGASALPQHDPGHYKLPTPRPFDASSDYWKFATLAARCIQEENTVWDCTDARAALVMRTVDRGLLRRTLLEKMEDEDVLRWSALLRNWRSSVGSSRELFHRNDEFVRHEWPGRHVLTNADTKSRPSVNKNLWPKVKRQRDATMTRDTALKALAALLVIIAILIGLWTFLR